MLIRIRRSKNILQQFQWFKCSSFALILEYTVRLAIINAAELEQNGCLFLSLLRNVMLWLKRTSTKSLQIELVTKYDTNDAKRKVWKRGPNLRRGFISAHEFEPQILIRIQPNTSERLNWKKKIIFCKPRWCSIVAFFSGKYDKTPLFKVSPWPFIPAGIYVDGNITFTPGKSKLTWRC